MCDGYACEGEEKELKMTESCVYWQRGGVEGQ